MQEKTKFLRDLPSAKHPVELFSADMTVPGAFSNAFLLWLPFQFLSAGSYDEAITDATYVINAAAVVALDLSGLLRVHNNNPKYLTERL